MDEKRTTDDLQVLLEMLPEALMTSVEDAGESKDLLEIVMDLGRLPAARFTFGEVQLSEKEIIRADLDYLVSRTGDFDADNRAGIERTLHRISAIRNRRSVIVGVTCRIGRAVFGTIEIIEDLLKSGKSILILGRPGIGKTTMLREAARILSETKRVVIVDTSNEIGGDGDVPHPAVGKARRMQVAKPTLQHEVMIEAVENHNPEVIVIDEIGRELEAAAARTIAERGVQLVGTAHGRTLENLLLNPTLSDLIGGIESVTLSDEEARRRGTQKTVLERRAPPTFDVLVEIQERDHLVIHPDVANAVDDLVRGVPLQSEVRSKDERGKIKIEKPSVTTSPRQKIQGMRRGNGIVYDAPGKPKNQKTEHIPKKQIEEPQHSGLNPIRVFPYGVARNRLTQAAKRLGVPAIVVRDGSEADVLMTLRSYYRGRQQTILMAEQNGMPIYVLRSNTLNQMENSLAEMFNISLDMKPKQERLVEDQTQNAIQAVLNGQRWVDMPPASAEVRRLQHNLARNAKLVSHSYGNEPNRHVRIFRE
ncbi:MAG: AAA family ATPase [Anaerolineaceae bacterium]|nr:AAA family ATPase [Anaerolineaceae bacterium]